MKTPEEIKAKIIEGFKGDPFGFGVSDIMDALPFEDVRYSLCNEFLRLENPKEEWETKHQLKTDEDIKKKMLEYLDFAWEKANNERSLSSERSICHFIAWAWLLDNDTLYKELERRFDTDYAPYGKPILHYLGTQLGYNKNNEVI